jgi:hypothetical protein
LVLDLPALSFNVSLQGGEEAFRPTANKGKIPNRFGGFSASIAYSNLRRFGQFASRKPYH